MNGKELRSFSLHSLQSCENQSNDQIQKSKDFVFS